MVSYYLRNVDEVLTCLFYNFIPQLFGNKWNVMLCRNTWTHLDMVPIIFQNFCSVVCKPENRRRQFTDECVSVIVQLERWHWQECVPASRTSRRLPGRAGQLWWPRPRPEAIGTRSDKYVVSELWFLTGWFLNSTGPKSDPCGTPYLTFLLSQYELRYLKKQKTSEQPACSLRGKKKENILFSSAQDLRCLCISFTHSR